MADEIQIRLAEVKDADVLAKANMAMAWETERKRLDGDTIRQGVRAVFDDAQRGFYVVATKDGQIAGSLMVTFEWSDWRDGFFWWIQSVYVRPGFRRQGVFRRLFQHLEAEARSRDDVCGIRLYVEHENSIAQRTYATLGLQPTPYHIYECEL